jgi:hypothetical protein
VFPIYHAFTQELSPHHQGKISGAGGVAAFILSPAHTFFGQAVDRTGSFDIGLALAGCLPLAAFAVLATLWGKDPSPLPPSPFPTRPSPSPPPP